MYTLYVTAITTFSLVQWLFIISPNTSPNMLHYCVTGCMCHKELHFYSLLMLHLILWMTMCLKWFMLKSCLFEKLQEAQNNCPEMHCYTQVFISLYLYNRGGERKVITGHRSITATFVGNTLGWHIYYSCVTCVNISPDVIISHYKGFAQRLRCVEPDSRIFLHCSGELSGDRCRAGVQCTGNGGEQCLIWTGRPHT